MAPLLTAKLPPALPKSKQSPPQLSSRPAAGPEPAPGVHDELTTAANVRDCQAVIRQLQAENQRQAVEVLLFKSNHLLFMHVQTHSDKSKTSDSLVVSVLDQRPRGRGFESRWLRAVA